MILTDTGYDAVPTGMQPAALVNIFDLGISPHGNRCGLNECVLLFELAASTEEKPLLLTKRYVASLSKNSTLRIDLESWRGKGLTDTEAKIFDTEILIGVNARLNIVRRKWRGIDFYDIDAILPPRGKRYTPQTPKSYVPAYIAREIEENNRINQAITSRDQWKAYTYLTGFIAMIELVLLVLNI